MLPGRPHAYDADIGLPLAQRRRDAVLHLPGVLTHQAAGIFQFCHAVVDVQTLPAFGCPLDDYAVEPGALDERAEETVGLGEGGAIGQGTFGSDGVGAAAGYPGGGQRAGGDDQPVGGIVPLHSWRNFIVQNLGTDGGGADPGAPGGGVERLLGDGLVGQVHPKELAGKAGRRGRLVGHCSPREATPKGGAARSDGAKVQGSVSGCQAELHGRRRSRVHPTPCVSRSYLL